MVKLIHITKGFNYVDVESEADIERAIEILNTIEDVNKKIYLKEHPIKKIEKNGKRKRTSAQVDELLKLGCPDEEIDRAVYFDEASELIESYRSNK